jgi:hypothetical protein
MAEDLAGGQQGRQCPKHGRGAEAADRLARMKFKDERPFASVDAAVKKLLEIANRLEADPRRPASDWGDQRAIPQGRRQRCRIQGGAKGRSRTRAHRPAPVRRVYDVHQAGADLFA